LGLAGLVPLAACATLVPPRPGALERAQGARTYSASLRVSLKSPTLRGGSRAILAFTRPDALRLELPGPSGVLCIAVARGPVLTAVFPASRAVWEGASTAEEMEALLGVRLSPSELMDLLTGVAPPGVTEYRASWGPDVPTRVFATLHDGSRLEARVESADLAPTLPAAAFEPPPRAGYRRVTADEARRLLGIR
jgi:hypothetical protein